MNNISSGKNSTVILLVALAFALLFAVYYYLVMPKKDEVVSKENSITSLEATAESLRGQFATVELNNTKPVIDTFALRKKVPQSRTVDQLLLNIEQMEFVSGNRIQSIAFNNYDSLVSASGLTDPNFTSQQDGETADTSEAGTSDGSTASTENGQSVDATVTTTPVSTIAPEQLPAELKMLTLSISIESPNHDALLSFVREVEQLERVIRVDTISYSLPGEEAVFDTEASDIVNATIQVTTFYYEGEQ